MFCSLFALVYGGGAAPAQAKGPSQFTFNCDACNRSLTQFHSAHLLAALSDDVANASLSTCDVFLQSIW